MFYVQHLGSDGLTQSRALQSRLRRTLLYTRAIIHKKHREVAICRRRGFTKQQRM